MAFLETHGALVQRLLDGDSLDAVTVRQGQFHHVVIGSDRVVCFARTKAAAARLPDRAAKLRQLAALDLGFRTPEPLPTGGSAASDQPPFLVLSRIPGAPLKVEVLQDAETAELVATQYAKLLAGLARAGATSAARSALPPASPDRWRQFAADVRAELFVLMSSAGRTRAERELAGLDGLPHLTDAAVHGDLGRENVLWEFDSGQPRLSGVIDWDEVQLGDPAEDLAAIGASNSTNLMERVLKSGSRSDTDLTARIATIRGTFALQQALTAHRDGDADELANGLTTYV